ncbi:type II toxin-antitoxin system HicB family antitoxin, partial [Acinetobacter baumannii]
MFFPIAIEQGSEDQSFGVIVPDIPGCFSAGDTLDEAIRNVKEAISIHLELLASAEEAIPTAQ